MRLSSSTDHAATPDDVFAVVTTEEFQAEKCRRTMAEEFTVSIESELDSATVRTERVLPTDSLPDFVTKFVGSSLKVVETQEWDVATDDGARHAEVSITIVGAPVRLTGTIDVTPTRTGCRQVVEIDLVANIPFIGGKVEKAAAGPIGSAIDVELATLAEFLAR